MPTLWVNWPDSFARTPRDSASWILKDLTNLLIACFSLEIRNFTMVSTNFAGLRAANFQEVKSKELPLLERWLKTPRSSFLTKLPVLLTNRARRSFSRLLIALWKAVLALWLLTDCRLFETANSYLYWTRAKLWKRERTMNSQTTRTALSTSSSLAWKCDLLI